MRRHAQRPQGGTQGLPADRAEGRDARRLSITLPLRRKHSSIGSTVEQREETLNRGMVQRARDEESGFTLIELVIVIVILGVLAGIVIFAVGGITDNGNVAACKSRSVKTVFRRRSRRTRRKKRELPAEPRAVADHRPRQVP